MVLGTVRLDPTTGFTSHESEDFVRENGFLAICTVTDEHLFICGSPWIHTGLID